MDEIFGAILLITGGAITLTALFAVTGSLFPRRFDQTRQAADSMPGRAFVIGLVNFLFFGALVFGFVALAEATGWNIFFIPAILLLAAIAVGLTFGLTGVVQLVGDRLYPERSPLQRTAWGTVTLYLACLTPFIGWFGVLVYAGLLGLGAFILSFFRTGVNTTPEDV